jgi:hypothetical protein
MAPVPAAQLQPSGPDNQNARTSSFWEIKKPQTNLELKSSGASGLIFLAVPSFSIYCKSFTFWSHFTYIYKPVRIVLDVSDKLSSSLFWATGIISE